MIECPWCLLTFPPVTHVSLSELDRTKGHQKYSPNVAAATTWEKKPVEDDGDMSGTSAVDVPTDDNGEGKWAGIAACVLMKSIVV